MSRHSEATAEASRDGGRHTASARGRPTKLTAPLITRICVHVRAGNFLETAALACGVTRQSLYNWLRLANEALDAGYGEEPDPAAVSVPVFTALEELCVEFLVAMEQATAEADIADMALIADAAQTDWRAAAWRTARRDRRKERESAAARPPASPPSTRPKDAKPTPQTHPEWFKTDEQRRADDEFFRTARRGEYLTWKAAREAQAAAGTALTPAEQAYDQRNAREFEREAWRIKMEPLWAKLDRKEYARRHCQPWSEEQDAADQAKLKAAHDLATSRGPEYKPIPEKTVPTGGTGGPNSDETAPEAENADLCADTPAPSPADPSAISSAISSRRSLGEGGTAGPLAHDEAAITKRMNELLKQYPQPSPEKKRPSLFFA